MENISRCPKCNLISFLSYYYKDGKSYIDYQCENNHSGTLSLEEYLQNYNIFSLPKEKCSECNKNQSETSGNLYFCSKCNKFLCHSCIINHSNSTQHNFTNINRYDALCKLHSNYYGFYCNQCMKNLCVYCKDEHNSHDIIDLIKYKNENESIQSLEEKIKNVKNKLNNLEQIKNSIVNEINNIVKSSELEIKYFNILLDTLKYEENQNNANYNIIENIMNFAEIFDKYKIKLLDKIIIESNNFVSSLYKLGFRNSFKKLSNGNGAGRINHILKLKDGRLLASYGTGLTNIYNKDNFEIQLSLRPHYFSLEYCTQLNNGNVLTCSHDKTMTIIKLINDNNYNIEQQLLGHSSYICKAIELRDNELISVAGDKTMKLWALNNNKYECKNTITFQNETGSCNILKLNENEFITSSRYDKLLRFWNSVNYTNISNIDNIESDCHNESLCKLDDDILCVGGNNSKGFYLIKISTHQLIKNIPGPNNVFCIYKCFDNYFLCSILKNNNYSLIKYKYHNQNLIKKIEKASNVEIYNCIELNKETVVSSGYSINLWKY